MVSALTNGATLEMSSLIISSISYIGLLLLKGNPTGTPSGTLSLSKAICEQLDFNGGRNVLIKDIVNGIKDGHIDVELGVDLLHTFGAEVTLGNHLHLYLCTLDTVASPIIVPKIRFRENWL